MHVVWKYMLLMLSSIWSYMWSCMVSCIWSCNILLYRLTYALTLLYKFQIQLLCSSFEAIYSFVYEVYRDFQFFMNVAWFHIVFKVTLQYFFLPWKRFSFTSAISIYTCTPCLIPPHAKVHNIYLLKFVFNNSFLERWQFRKQWRINQCLVLEWLILQFLQLSSQKSLCLQPLFQKVYKLHISKYMLQLYLTW